MIVIPLPASREVANLTERKFPQAPVYGVKEYVCLSVTKFDPIISGLSKQNGLNLGTGRTEWAVI